MRHRWSRRSTRRSTRRRATGELGPGAGRPDPLLPWIGVADVGPMEPLDGALRADTDEICPGCLQWFETGAYVRRNAYGLLQHEACPVRASRD